jgi:hypothetical protein
MKKRTASGISAGNKVSNIEIAPKLDRVAHRANIDPPGQAPPNRPVL